MIFLKTVYILMPLTIVLAFLWAPAAEVLGETTRILYFHVPMAWVSVLAFLVSAVGAVIYLRNRGKKYPLMEHKYHNAAVLGTMFAVITTITGSIWAKLMWGSYWNWDPRETSILLLLLIYIAYFSLRSALRDNPARGRICAAYLIFAMATVPFFVFVVPRVYPSLHPDPVINQQMKIDLDRDMRTVLMLSLLSFTLLYFYLFTLRNRISRLRYLNEVRNDELL